jgi:hypothetical protein
MDAVHVIGIESADHARPRALQCYGETFPKWPRIGGTGHEIQDLISPSLRASLYRIEVNPSPVTLLSGNDRHEACGFRHSFRILDAGDLGRIFPSRVSLHYFFHCETV